MNDIWDGWKITEEQRLKMVEGDREALDRFYFENYNHLFALAVKYAKKKRDQGCGDLYLAEDLIQDLYIVIPRLNFTTPMDFVVSMYRQFYRFPIEEPWSKTSDDLKIKSFLNLCFWVDEPMHENNPEKDMRRIDAFFCSPSPAQELARAREDLRQEKIAADLEPILRRIFTPRQYQYWLEGRIENDHRAKLRAHSAELLQFLREHGTPECKLQGTVETLEERRAKSEDRKALLAWEREHLDELTPERRRAVIHNMKCQEYVKLNREARNARRRAAYAAKKGAWTSP